MSEQIDIAGLRKGLAQILKLVEEGAEYEVTRYGKVIASLGPVGPVIVPMPDISSSESKQSQVDALLKQINRKSR